MNGWRGAYGTGLVVFIVAPLAMPIREMLSIAVWTWTAEDAGRLADLGKNTLMLIAGTIGLSLPAGILLAVLLFRTSFFTRRWLRFLLAFGPFIPLPIIVISWQGLLGSSARPWATGMSAAIWIHALAALPWVTLIVGLGLMWVEPELEDEAAQSVGPWRVLAVVTLPRVRASLLVAVLFVALQTAGETNVTDLMQVATLADAMRTQFTLNDRAGLGRTLVLTLPGLLLAWAAVISVISYIQNRLPPLAPPFREARALALGASWFRLSLASALMGLLILPAFFFIWRLGLAGYPSQWEAETAWHYLRAESRLLGGSLLATLATSLFTGSMTAALALAGCWLARDRRWFRWLLFSVLTWVWVLPGPAVGIALHDWITLLVSRLPQGPVDSFAIEKLVQFLKSALYHGPSPLPLVWVQVMRALPIGVVFLWPVVRLIPREWFEEARLAGAGSVSELLHVVLPAAWRAGLVTALALAALCLGEVAASARVETPGWESFTKMLLDRAHYGLGNSLAALSVLMLGSLFALAAAGSAIAWLMRWWACRAGNVSG